MMSKGFQSKHGELWKTRNKGKWPNKKPSSLRMCPCSPRQGRVLAARPPRPRQRPLWRTDLYQQTCSPAATPYTTFYCISVPWCNGENPPVLRSATAHRTKHSGPHTPRGRTQQLSSTLILQRSSDEASHGVSVPVSGWTRRCQTSSSNPVYLLLVGLRVNEAEPTDCGTSTCWADILLPPPRLSDF